MKTGADGARDHHGDLLPELSASASKMKYEKLVNAPLPTFDKDYPGSPFSWNWVTLCSGEQYTHSSERFRLQEPRRFQSTEEVCVLRGTQTGWSILSQSSLATQRNS